MVAPVAPTAVAWPVVTTGVVVATGVVATGVVVVAAALGVLVVNRPSEPSVVPSLFVATSSK